MPKPLHNRASENLFDLGGSQPDGWETPSKPKDDKPPRPEYIPIASFDTLNIADELLIQLNNAKHMLQDAVWDEETPLNQKAQTVNSITTILQQIAKTQTDIYNAERIKTLESTLIAVLKDYPNIKKQFMDRLEEALTNV